MATLFRLAPSSNGHSSWHDWRRTAWPPDTLSTTCRKLSRTPCKSQLLPFRLGAGLTHIYRFEYFRAEVLASSDKAKDAVAAIFGHTDPSDTNLRGRMVAYAVVNKPFLDTTPQGQAVRSLMEVHVPWTWNTCIQTMAFRDMQTVNLSPATVTPAAGLPPVPVQQNQGPVHGAQTYYG